MKYEMKPQNKTFFKYTHIHMQLNRESFGKDNYGKNIDSDVGKIPILFTKIYKYYRIKNESR